MKLWFGIKLILTIIVLMFAALCVVVVFRLDNSFTKIDCDIIPEVANSGFTSRPPLVLVSYADGDPTFFKNQNALVQSAADKGFDYIFQFKRNSISKDFWDQNRAILEQKRGAGYWLWKPYLILKAMRQLPENSVIVYADGAVVFTKSLKPILKLLETNDAIFDEDGRLISEQLKKEAYGAFGAELTQEMLQSRAIQGDFMIIKNTSSMRKLIERWLEICVNEEVITDAPLDPKNQAHDFSWHSNDQVILSLVAILAKEKMTILPKEKLSNQYGVKNFHRKKHREFSSPLWLIADMPDFFSRVIWNNSLMMTIRRIASDQ